jgi:hypothetical protein
MKRIHLLLLMSVATTTVISSTSLKANYSLSTTQVIKQSPVEDADTVYRIIPAPGNTYGYEILVKNKVMIRQLNIPGKPGTKGFSKKRDAQKVAKLVIEKIKQGIMPPTVHSYEMERLSIKL